MSITNDRYDLPSDMVEQLLCSICNGYVSCGPVKVRFDGGTICGRCSPCITEECPRHLLFETAMSKFTFPCRYKAQGCNQRVLFGDVEHEYVCPYRTFECPSYGSCSANVSVFDVYKHFQETHENLIIKNWKFKLDLKQDSQCNFLMVENNVFVNVQYSYDSTEKIFYLDVRYFSSNNQQGVGYQLQIISGVDSDCTINFKENLCRHYEWCMLTPKSATNFIMSNYLPALDNPEFVYIKIKMTNSSKSSLTCNAQPVIEDKPLLSVEQKILTVWNSLENIRCHFCHCFAIPPVYTVCKNGSNHICCYDCKSTYYNSSAQQTKVEIPYFPCRWRGCTFMGNESNIREHVQNCEFQTYICPASCQEGCFTLNNLMTHMKQHGTFCPDPKKIVVLLFGDSKTYFTIFKGTVLLLTYNSSSMYGTWALQCKNKISALNIDIYFEHNHCLFKSKTYSFSHFNFDGSNFNSEFPKCFNYCKRITAVIEIKDMKT